MNDSRVTRVADFVSDAELETDQIMQVLLVKDALAQWTAFADEFPVNDVQVNMVTVRLWLGLRHAQLGNWRASSESLRLAKTEIQVVNDR